MTTRTTRQYNRKQYYVYVILSSDKWIGAYNTRKRATEVAEMLNKVSKISYKIERVSVYE